MTACPHCNSVRVIMDHTKDGHPYLRDYGQPHKFTCSVNKKTRPKKPGAKVPLQREREDPETRVMVVKNWGRTQAEELLPYAKGETLEDQFLSVLHYINNKGGG